MKGGRKRGTIFIPKEKAINLLKKGYSQRSIVNKLNISLGSVNRLAQEMGLGKRNIYNTEAKLWELACKNHLLVFYKPEELEFNKYFPPDNRGNLCKPDVYIPKLNTIIEFKLNCDGRTIKEQFLRFIQFAGKVEFWFKYGNLKTSIKPFSRNLVYELQKKYPSQLLLKDMSKEILV